MKYSAVVVVAALGLTPNLALAYGINMSQKGSPVRWGVDTVAFRMDPSMTEAFPNGDAYTATTMAFDAWRGLPRVPDLVLRPGAPEPRGYRNGGPTNGIYLLREWDMSPEMLAVTVVTYGSDTGEVLDADILVNGEAPWALMDESAPRDVAHYDLAAVLAHEAGHSLGLDESHTDEEATMWPQVHPGDTHQRTLSLDDEEGVIANYAGTIPEAAAGCGTASVLGGRAGSGSSLLFALGALAAMLLLARMASRKLVLRRGALAFGLCGLVAAAPFGAPASEGAAPRTGAERAAACAAESAAQARFARVFGQNAGPRTLVRGRAHRLASTWKDGFITTEYAVRDASGAEHRIELFGGEVGGIGQRFMHEELPEDGAEVVLSGEGSSVGRRWAYYRDGLVFGGSLGEGAAVRLP